MKFRQVYPQDRWKQDAVVRSAIWVNTEIDTKSWKTLNVPNTNDISAIQIKGAYGRLSIFNIYNSCDHSRTEDIIRKYLRDNANDTWRGPDSHMMWCGDFNRHHPMWDRDEDLHLFTTGALDAAGHLIELIADHDMEMALPKGVPTLQHLVSKRYSRPDNVFCSSVISEMVIRCEVDPRARPTKTDHFPIVTILELPQERIKPKATYDFRMADWEDFRENLTIRLAEIPEPSPLLTDQDFQKAAEDLTEAIRDTIRTRVKLKRLAPQSRRWWNRDLSNLRKQLNKLSAESYRFRAIEIHPSHRALRKIRNKYGNAIIEAKRQHWSDFLEEATADDIWTANKYLKEPVGDGGNPRIPTLKVDAPGDLAREVNTNEGKAILFGDTFFPKPPTLSGTPREYDYPDPLPNPPKITPGQIERQIRRLSPYKASGPDEIPNIVLQKSYDLIADHLLHLFQAVFTLRTYYPAWKEFTTVVLRKPGKPSYETPKAYRPIALLCTMAKILTAIVAEDISRLVEEHQLLPSTHFGGRPGRTTTDALHYLTHKIKTAWRQGKVASVLFLDVEGAFPNAVTDRLVHNLRKRRIPEAYIAFIRRLLEGRRTKLKFDDFTSEPIDIVNGIGQGDPLSMILYIIYNADLIDYIALHQDEDAIGYVDDAVIIAYGTDFNESVQKLTDMMNRDQDGGFAWSKTHNSKYEISKLAVLHASLRSQPDPENQRKRIPLDRPPLKLQGVTIKEVTSYKYLGIHIDSQLRWTVQSQEGVAKATKWIMQFKRLSRVSGGIKAKLMRQLYISVAIPKMTYALDVWYTPPSQAVGQKRNTGSVGVLRQMQKLQRIATLSIVGGMKSTPTDLLDAHAKIFPIELTFLRICHRATVRLCTLPNTHPLFQVTRSAANSFIFKHQGPIEKLLKLFKIKPSKYETIAPNISPPTLETAFTTLIAETREESMDSEKADTSLYRIYTDGSGYEGKAGASAVLYKRGTELPIRSLQYHLGPLTQHTTYEAEAVGAILAAWIIQTQPELIRSTVSIYTDSQALIKATKSRRNGSGSYLLTTFRALTRAVPNELSLRWISGHTEVMGNEEADKLAKDAAQGESSPHDQLPPLLRRPLPYSATARKQVYTTKINNMWVDLWSTSPRKERMDRIDPDFPFKKFTQIQYKLSKAQSSLLIQLRSGHIPLNAHLHRLGCAETNKCPACDERRGGARAKETVIHYLFECTAYRHERLDMDRALGPRCRDLKAIMSNYDHIKALLHFVSQTRRLQRNFGDVSLSLTTENTDDH